MRYLLVGLVWLVCQSGITQTVSEWRGINRTGIYDESNLLSEWPESGPEKLWSVGNLGTTYSSPAIGEKYIYVTGRKDSLEYLTALDFKGEQKWQVQFGRAWTKSFPDTRTTPTIHGNNIYLISGMGEVACHNAETGEQVWFRNANEEYSGICGLYGPSESPLIVDDKVFYTPGGNETSMIALDIYTGELAWKTRSLGDSAAYVSPVYVKHNDQEMIINLMSNWAFGVDPADGEILWEFDYIAIESPIQNRYMRVTNCNTPIYHEGDVAIIKGYDHPVAMLSLNEAGTEATLKWKSEFMDTHTGGNVLIDGLLYGSNWLNNGMGSWVCLDWSSGELKWETKWNNKGSVIYADGMLYCYDEKRGNIALVNPNSEKFDIVSSFKVDEGKGPHWSHPVINDGVLYVIHGERLIAYNIMNPN